VVELIEIPSFSKERDRLLNEETMGKLVLAIASNPEVGAVVSGTGGIRKLRVQRPGMGKRGGARVLYYYISARARVYLLMIYAKAGRDSITAAEKTELQKLTRILDGEP
jgi:hypothetical protein